MDLHEYTELTCDHEINIDAVIRWLLDYISDSDSECQRVFTEYSERIKQFQEICPSSDDQTFGHKHRFHVMIGLDDSNEINYE